MEVSRKKETLGVGDKTAHKEGTSDASCILVTLLFGIPQIRGRRKIQ